MGKKKEINEMHHGVSRGVTMPEKKEEEKRPGRARDYNTRIYRNGKSKKKRRMKNVPAQLPPYASPPAPSSAYPRAPAHDSPHARLWSYSAD